MPSFEEAVMAFDWKINKSFLNQLEEEIYLVMETVPHVMKWVKREKWNVRGEENEEWKLRKRDSFKKLEKGKHFKREKMKITSVGKRTGQE